MIKNELLKLSTEQFCRTLAKFSLRTLAALTTDEDFNKKALKKLQQENLWGR